MRILTLSSFFFPFPSPPHPFRPPSPPQGLSHLMMSEQGRCLVLATLQLPRIACLRASGWPLGVSLLLAGRFLPVPPAVGRAGSRPPWGGGYRSRCILVSCPRHPFGLSILHHHLSSRALALPGCLQERSMKQGMTASIMGVNGANFRATERLTSSCSSPGPMLGPCGWRRGAGLLPDFHSE